MKKLWGLLFLFCTFTASPSGLEEKIVGRVGEEFISLSSFRLYKKKLGAGLVYKTALFKLESIKSLLSDDKKLLSFMTKDLMLDQIASKLNLEPSSAHLESSVKSIQKNLSHTAFAKKLSKYNYSLKALKVQIHKDLKKDLSIRQAVFSKIKISEDDINSYYFGKKGVPLYTSFLYDVSFVSFPKTSDGLKKAKEILSSIKKTSFKRATHRLSVERKSLKTSQLDPSMEKALKHLSISKTSTLTPIQNRMYIFKLNWKTPVLSASKEKDKQKYEALLFEKELKKELKKWLINQKKNFFITTNSL